MNKLICSIRWNPPFRDSVFGNCFRTAITTRVRSRCIAMDVANSAVTDVTGQINDFFRINVLDVSPHNSLETIYLVENHSCFEGNLDWS